jgi:hypothetical protein
MLSGCEKKVQLPQISSRSIKTGITKSSFDSFQHLTFIIIISISFTHVYTQIFMDCH